MFIWTYIHMEMGLCGVSYVYMELFMFMWN
jgi:hypothetical protein